MEHEREMNKKRKTEDMKRTIEPRQRQPKKKNIGSRMAFKEARRMVQDKRELEKEITRIEHSDSDG